jgi:hypothetical protein
MWFIFQWQKLASTRRSSTFDLITNMYCTLTKTKQAPKLRAHQEDRLKMLFSSTARFSAREAGRAVVTNMVARWRQGSCSARAMAAPWFLPSMVKQPSRLLFGTWRTAWASLQARPQRPWWWRSSLPDPDVGGGEIRQSWRKFSQTLPWFRDKGGVEQI